MSLTKKMTVNCPRCGKQFAATVFESINTDYTDSIPAQIMNGKLFDVECPNCKSVFHLEYDILYHDLRNGSMIWVLHKDSAGYEEKTAELRATKILPYKVMRIVEDMNALREKVSCLERGRDDRIIELCKVFTVFNLLLQKPDFEFKNAFYTAASGKEIIHIYDNNGKSLCSELSNQTYDFICDLYLGSNWSAQFDNNYAIVDYAWAEKILISLLESESQNIPSSSEEKEAIKLNSVNNDFNPKIEAKFQDNPKEKELLCVNNKEQLLTEIEIMEIKGEIPVVIESAHLYSSLDKEKIYLRCKFRSLTDRIISALMIDVHCFDVWGNELPTVYDVQILDLSPKRDEEFGFTQKVSLADTNTRSVKIKLKKIRFADGTIIECIGNEYHVPKDILLENYLDSIQLKEQYIREISDNASMVPKEIGKFWKCSCGRINALLEIKCSLCNAEKHTVFNSLNKEFLSERYSAYITEKQMREKAAQQERENRERIEAEIKALESVKATEERINNWKKKHPIIDGTGYRVTIDGTMFKIPKRCMRCLEPTERFIHNYDYGIDMPVCSECQEEKRETIVRITREIENTKNTAKAQARKVVKGAIVWGIVLNSLLYAALYLITVNWKICSAITLVCLFVWLLLFSNKKIRYTLPGYHVLADLKNTNNNGFYKVSTDIRSEKTTFTFTNGAYALLFAETNNVKQYYIDAKADYMSSSPQAKAEPAKNMYPYSFGPFVVMALIIVILTLGLNYVNQEYDLSFVNPIRAKVADLFPENNRNSKTDMTGQSKTAKATNPPQTMPVNNGQIIVNSDYKGLCELMVKAGSDSNYYVYLDYQHAPNRSYDDRTVNKKASIPYEDDIAFIVKAGKTVEINVPIGVYKMYYATGNDFYGRDIKFGTDGHYYVADTLMDFYSEVDGDYIVYNGHEVTLYSVVNGNLDTDPISEKLFPD